MACMNAATSSANNSVNNARPFVGLARSARIYRDAGELLGVVRDLKGIAGVIGSKIGDEDKRLASACCS